MKLPPELPCLDRRGVLQAAAVTALASLAGAWPRGPVHAATVRASAATRSGWAAAWDGEAGTEIGVVAPQGAAALRVQARLAVPTAGARRSGSGSKPAAPSTAT